MVQKIAKERDKKIVKWQQFFFLVKFQVSLYKSNVIFWRQSKERNSENWSRFWLLTCFNSEQVITNMLSTYLCSIADSGFFFNLVSRCREVYSFWGIWGSLKFQNATRKIPVFALLAVSVFDPTLLISQFGETPKCNNLLRLR